MRDETKTRIVEAAAQLLREHGPAAVTTRAVALAAGVQAPAIYRIFGDKDGLLEAVAEKVMSVFIAEKYAILDKLDLESLDPVEELRRGWFDHLEFGTQNPALFRLLSDPERMLKSPTTARGRSIIEARVHRMAAQGRLKVAEPLAVDLILASGVGAINTINATSMDQRIADFAQVVFDGVLNQILTDSPAAIDTSIEIKVITLRAVTDQLDSLSASERQMLEEWLDRSIGRLT